jgi:hypothetical protein
MAIFCERCGAEIGPGQPIAAWTNGEEMVIVHRFPGLCDERGVERVRDLEKKYADWKRDNEGDARPNQDLGK